MKRFGAGLLMSLLAFTAFGQSSKAEHTLLWKVSGNGLEKPSYLFGTMHMICKDDATLSRNMLDAISSVDRVYFELDMDNLFEMMSALGGMKMKNDTTLADLLSKADYERVKDYFEKHSTMLPFSMLETYKPLLASSLLMESSMLCEEQVAMEQLIMEEAKKHNKRIEGLETMAYQMSIFDSIPYRVQAEELLKSITTDDKTSESEAEFRELMEAYREQDLDKLGQLVSKTDGGMMQFEDILLNNRNRNWVTKLKVLFKERSLLVAVGAGHLTGEKGLIQLLRKEGFSVTPVENREAAATKTREI